MEKIGSIIFVTSILILTFGVGMVIIAANIKPITTTQTVTVTQTVIVTTMQMQTAKYAYSCQYSLLNGTIWEYSYYQSNVNVSASEYTNGQLIAQISCVPN